MDTRTKILSSDQAAQAARDCRDAGRRVLAVTGYFDPLTAAHARRLSAIAQPGSARFVALADPPDPLLPARARAELVAGLAAVDCVILPGSSLQALRADTVYDERASDESRTADLIRHVQSRQK